MKISQEEIDAACFEYFKQSAERVDADHMRFALEAALRVRKVRKKAAREAKFKPCAIQYDEIRATEIMLTDQPVFWRDNAADKKVEIAYSFDGLLVGVRLWGLEATTPRPRPPEGNESALRKLGSAISREFPRVSD